MTKPSLQARFCSLVARAYLKRRPVEDETAFVQFARRRFTLPKLLRPPLSAHTVIKPVNTDGVQGEWLTTQNAAARHTIYYLQ